MLIKSKAHDVAIEIDPAVHFAPAHIADNVIDVQKADWTRDPVAGLSCQKTGQKRSVIIPSFNERMDSIPVSSNGSDTGFAVCIPQRFGFANAAGAATRRRFHAAPASSTHRPMSCTPSPWRAITAAAGSSDLSGVVSTKRTLFCVTT